jgi:hypothetical protein
MTTTKKAEFHARSDLHGTLKYRPHIRWFYYLLLWNAGLVGVTLAGASVVMWMMEDMQMGLIFLAASIVMALVLVFEARIFLRPYAFAKAHVGPAALGFEYNGKTETINYQDVTKVEFADLGFLGGWFRLHLASGKKIKFTSVLERGEYILEALAVAKPEVVPKDRMEHYRITSITADHSWARLYVTFKAWRTLIKNYVAIPGMMCVMLFVFRTCTPGLQKHLPLLSWLSIFAVIFLLNGAVGFFTWFSVDTHFLKKTRAALAADPLAVRRDMVLEEQFMKKAHRVHMKITLGIFVVMILLNFVY